MSRRKDPEGNYVVAMDLETYELLNQSINRLGLDVEFMGNIVVVRDRSWSRINKLVNIARELGINVNDD
ncbi:hypothetical protein [Vulcanisaeta sp. JCM 16161]|uniref:hypothetical protein n=1 Tax=Vulcanisaeta sp. JCM 16161 TaxID=1295372 RepID=UPI00406C0382